MANEINDSHDRKIIFFKQISITINLLVKLVNFPVTLNIILLRFGPTILESG